jgi:hypothetical protein
MRLAFLGLLFAVIVLPLTAHAQSGEDEPGAGEPGKPGSSTVVHGGSGAPGPSGAPGQVITPPPDPTAAPEGSGTTESTPTPTVRPPRTPSPEPVRVSVSRSSDRREWSLVGLAGAGILAGAGLVVWAWRRRPA